MERVGRRSRRRGRSERSGSSNDAPMNEAPPFGRRTVTFGGMGLATVVLGFFLLAQGSIQVAPVLLVLGFCVLLPLALIN